jgi:hypothetical protein
MMLLRLSRNRPSQDGVARKSAEELPAPVPDPLARFQMTKQHAITLGDTLLRALTDNLRQGDRSQLEEIWGFLPFYFDVVATADFATERATAGETRATQEAVPAVPEYLISSLFLSTCASYLLANPQGFERLHLVTGIKERDKRRTLDRMARVALAQQSASGARADQLDLQNILLELDSFGLHLHGLFHSHPGSGAAMTRPSGIDLATQDRFESQGYPLVGAIFARGGFVRFFAHHPFTITVYGKGVVQHEEHLFHIQKHPGCLSHEADERKEGGAASLRPAGSGAWL